MLCSAWINQSSPSANLMSIMLSMGLSSAIFACVIFRVGAVRVLNNVFKLSHIMLSALSMVCSMPGVMTAPMA